MKTHPKTWTLYGETRCAVSIVQRFNHTMPCRTYSESRLNTHTLSPCRGRSKVHYGQACPATSANTPSGRLSCSPGTGAPSTPVRWHLPFLLWVDPFPAACTPPSFPSFPPQCAGLSVTQCPQTCPAHPDPGHAQALFYLLATLLATWKHIFISGFVRWCTV